MHIGFQTVINLNKEKIFEEALKIGANAFEIFFDGFVPSDISRNFRKRLKDKADEVFLSVHAPIENIYIPNGFKKIKASFEFANEIGAKIVIIHGKASVNRFIQKIKQLIPIALDYDMKIAIENVFNTTPKKINKIIKELNERENIGLTYDIGHAQLTSLYPENPKRDAYLFLQELKGPILEVHLHNNGGEFDEHLSIKDGIIPIDKIMQELIVNKKFDGSFIFEYWRNNMLNDFKYIKNLIHSF